MVQTVVRAACNIWNSGGYQDLEQWRIPGSGTVVDISIFPCGSPQNAVERLMCCLWNVFLPYNFNPLTPNDPYSWRTAPLTSKRCILYIYSTNIGTKYFKHAIYSPFFSLQNAVCFIILIYLVPVLFTFYIQDVLKLKNNNSGAKSLRLSRLEKVSL